MFLNCYVGRTLESPLDCKKIQSVNPKGNQSWMFTGRTDAEAETPILWPLDAKNWLIWKDPDAGKDWRQEEKGMTEDEKLGWHHQLDGHEFEQALGAGDRGLACCSPWESQRVGRHWVMELYLLCLLALIQVTKRILEKKSDGPTASFLQISQGQNDNGLPKIMVVVT